MSLRSRLITLLSLTGLVLIPVLVSPAAVALAEPPTPSPATPTPTPTLVVPSSAGVSGSSWLRPTDGMEMVYVPEGEFLMGSPEGEGKDDERPQHTVYLDAFWIDRTEVTNAQYRQCVDASACPPAACYEGHNYKALEQQPVACVDRFDADHYCAWAGARLPTEAEWEKAARGTDGRRYPWGNDDATCNYAVMDDGSGSRCGEAWEPWSVGSREAGASPYGALDMAGSVSEWVADWYDTQYYAVSPETNPTGPEEGIIAVQRGGSYANKADDVRSASRSWGTLDIRLNVVGFRCAAAGH